MNKIVLSVAVSACLVMLSGCKKDAPPAFLGIYPDMGCEKFAEVALPLHQNYKKLKSTSELSALEFGPTYVTQAQLVDACYSSYERKGFERYIYLATNSGTPIQLELFGSLRGFIVRRQSWISGGFSNVKFTDVANGVIATFDEAKKADEDLRQSVVGELGPPLVEARQSTDDKVKTRFWRRGSFLIWDRNIVVIRDAKAALEKSLKDWVDVELIAEALRKDGLKEI